MAKTALKFNSTQKFIEILDVYEQVLILSQGNAAIIIEVQATNFALLSPEEQDSKIYSYSALLNSLSFPIQIVVRSKRLDISNYLTLLENEAKNALNQNFANQILAYRNFVAQLIKVNTVLDKKFYVVIPFYSLESGALGAKQVLDKNTIGQFSQTAKSALFTKAETLLSQLSRIGLKANILEKEELVRVFYDIFNEAKLEDLNQSTLTYGKDKK